MSTSRPNTLVTLRLIAVAAALCAHAAAALGEELDRSSYRDLPAKWQTIISTIPVNRDDDLPEEVRQRYAGQRPYGKYMVYYGADGAIDAVDVVKSIAGCDELVQAWIRAEQTKYVPPDHGRVRRLSRVEVSFPPPPGTVIAPQRPKPVPATPGTEPKNLPPHLFNAQAVDHPIPHLPDKVRANHAGQEVTVMYYITVGTNGEVVSLTPFNGNATDEARRAVADVDAAVTETVRRWKFRPQPVPIRSVIRFEFTIVAAH